MNLPYGHHQPPAAPATSATIAARGTS
uniref:Uncharacterized protein n=1 Tax=Nymphaea colorata TaxID=210225 RepID=A0A5K1FI76_9MAGN